MKRQIIMVIFLLMAIQIYSQKGVHMNEQRKTETATLGGGCFWCTEAVFEEVEGVTNVISGYSGGDIINPSYREVTTGRTGHAEVVQLSFDPEVITYRQILEIFFKTHNPTTLNRQGADVGTQYRSVIFYQNERQKEIAQNVIEELENSGKYDDKIVTRVEELQNFYMAEDYHQDYFRKNPDQAYCSYVIKPKLKKFRKDFSEKLKPQ